MFLVTPSTVLNSAVLRPRRLGHGMLGRGFRVIPRRPLSDAMLWRVLLDQAPLRMLVALAALPFAAILPSDLALPLTPVLMLGAMMTAERTVLASAGAPAGRRGLACRGEADRMLDLLRSRGRDALGRIAAGRDMASDRLHLVVEQSPLARAPVLTLVSVQRPCDAGGRPEVIELSDSERSMLRARLFGGDLDEAGLHRVNAAQNRYVRSVPFEAGTVTAHARLLARTERHLAPPG